MSKDSKVTKSKMIPSPPKIPARPDKYHRLRLYSPLWRGHPGDSIAGHLLAVQPVETLERDEVPGLMLKLIRPAPILQFDERSVLETDAPADDIVGVPVIGAALGRLVDLLQRTDPKYAQTIEIHSVLVEIATPEGGLAMRRFFLCYIADEPALRTAVDPMTRQMLADEARRSAGT